MYYEVLDMFEPDSPNIFLKKDQWDKMTPAMLEDFKQQIFNYYRQSGFPYYNVSEEKRIIQFSKMRNKSYLALIQNKQIGQTMTGLGELWTYFPHAFHVQCENMLSPIQAFNDDKVLKLAIDKRIKYGTYINDSGMRKALKITSGVQAVSNFRPTAAAAIYSFFNAETVWDMSCGYGGRLLGAFISNSVKHYIGTEPCEPTITGLQKLRNHLVTIVSDFKISLHQIGSECFKPEPSSLDLCFTSPPYFRTEQYSNEATQSAIKFPEKQAWLEGFLAETMKNCYAGLKPGKYMLINIANVKAYPDLEQDCIKTAEKNGFILTDTLYYTLSKIMGTRKNRDKYKLEPVFVFQKT